MRRHFLAIFTVALVSAWATPAHAAASVITMNPNPVDVGNVVVGQTGMASGTLSDSNNEHLDLQAPSNCSGGGGTFTLNPTSNVNLNNPVTITVSYTPTARGVRTCRVDVRKAGQMGTIGSFQVRGNGLDPAKINITGTKNFGAVRWTDTAPVHSAPQTFTVTNQGDVPLVVSAVTLGGTNAGDYAITSGSVPQTLARNATANWTITFNPTAGGTRTASLTFASNDPTAGSMVLDLTGVGTNALINVDDLNYMIVNTGSSKTLDITMTNNGAATKGPLGVTTATISGGSWFTFAACNAGTTACTFSPARSFTTTSTVGVKCTPAANALPNDMQMATVTFVSDTDPPGSGTTDNVSMLTCTAGKSALATDLASVDFPKQLVMTSSTAKTLTATNTGNVATSFYLQITGVNAASFTVTAAGGCGTGAGNVCNLAPAASINIDVTFMPGTEADISAGLDLVSTTLPFPQLTLAGRGIDRHIATDAQVMFPDTFRNPGSHATVVGVAVRNIGEYPLHVTGVEVMGAPNWSLAAPVAPFDVPGMSSQDVMVKFAPEVAGKSPNGTMIVTSDDRTNATSTIMLAGNGKDRRVEMGPSTLDLGDTGAGVPTRLSVSHPGELLTITNDDADNAFTIRSIEIEGDQVFSVLGFTPGEELAAGATKTFDVELAPSGIGEFEGMAVLYLDEDPTSQVSVPLHGRALFVDAHGGGGCAAGGSGARGGMLLVLGALFAARRRRRVGAAVLACAALPIAAAHADPTRNIQLTDFDPTPTTAAEATALQVQPADVGASGDLAVMAIASYASNPLVLGTGDADDPVVGKRIMTSIGASYAFAKRFEAGLRMPFYTQSGDELAAGAIGSAPASGTARGDLTAHFKARLVRTPSLAIGAGVALTLPTATGGQFAGSEKPSGRALLLASIEPTAWLALHINAGAVLRAKAAFANIEQKSAPIGGAGATLHIAEPFAISAEVFGSYVSGGYHGQPAEGATMGTTSALVTVEAIGAAHYQIARAFSVTLGVGRGLTSGVGTPELRGVVMLEYAPIAHGRGGVHTATIVGGRTEAPLDPSVADSDHDRIPDATDKCPNEPEDRDRFEDEDGCPDLDNDKDGVPDETDKCPEPEDRDGFEDDDGCPDLDNDKDGIADAVDKCPDQPEKINGIDDNDGCPDTGEAMVMSTPERIELVQSVTFDGASIAPASAAVLGQLGATLRARGDILKIRIVAHVQPSRFAKRDQKLSDQRAAAVRDWLVHWGVEAGRIEVRGLGGTKPLIKPSQKGAALINDRIELIIIDRS